MHLWLHGHNRFSRPQELASDGAGTLLAGDPDRRVIEIVDPGRRSASVKVAGLTLLGADSDEGVSVEARVDVGGQSSVMHNLVDLGRRLASVKLARLSMLGADSGEGDFVISSRTMVL